MVGVRGGAGDGVEGGEEEDGEEDDVKEVETWKGREVSWGKGGRGGREWGLTDGYSFNFCMGKGDAQVVQGEHAVEGLDEEEDLFWEWGWSELNWKGYRQPGLTRM